MKWIRIGLHHSSTPVSSQFNVLWSYHLTLPYPALGPTPRMASIALPGLKNVPPLLNVKVPVEHVASSASPSTILNAASSLLPSFLHSSPSASSRSKPSTPKPGAEVTQSIPSNPLEGKDASHELFRAQKIEDYVKDHRRVRSRTGSTASVSSNRNKPGDSAGSETGYNDRADAHLPHVAAGEGEGPEVQYTKGVSPPINRTIEQ